MSAPVNIPQEGWNRLLQMRNGNTVLLHFDRTGPILVKIFDTGRAEIVNKKLATTLINFNRLKEVEVIDFLDINGAANLFVSLQIDNKNTLVRLSIDAANGNTIEEKIMVSSKSLADATHTKVVKQQGAEDYYIFCSVDIIKYPDTIRLIHYNAQHEIIKTIPFNINRKDFRHVYRQTVNMDGDGGICISVNLANDNITSANRTSAIYDKYLGIGYLPKNGDYFSATLVKTSPEEDSKNTLYAYNRMTKTMNVLLLSSREEVYEYGLNAGISDRIGATLLLIDSNTFTVQKSYAITNSNIKNLIKKADSIKAFLDVPTKIDCADNGVTTIISEEFNNYRRPKGRTNPFHTILGNVSVTRYNAEGKRIDSAVIRKQQFLDDYIDPGELSMYGSVKTYFINNDVEQEIQSQFCSLNRYRSGKDFYIVFNDYEKKNSDSTIQAGLPVYNFRTTNGVYYKINEKGELTRYYLFEPPANDESKASFLYGADFDPKHNTYATLVLCRKGTAYDYRVAWCHFN